MCVSNVTKKGEKLVKNDHGNEVKMEGKTSSHDEIGQTKHNLEKQTSNSTSDQELQTQEIIQRDKSIHLGQND